MLTRWLKTQEKKLGRQFQLLSFALRDIMPMVDNLNTAKRYSTGITKAIFVSVTISKTWLCQKHKIFKGLW